MFCKNCGKEINDHAVVCPYCGTQQELQKAGGNDTGSIGWGALGCCIPIVGLILFLVWKDEKPKNAKMAGIGALISVAVSAACYIFSACAGIAFGLTGM